MTVSTITTSSQSAAMALIQGTGQIDSASVSDLAAQGQGTDQVQLSKGGQLMGKLHQLALNDPEKFKQAVQGIADGLAEQAKNTTNADDAAKLTEMSQKFAQAAKNGDMSSLAPPKPEAMAQNGDANKLAMKFSGGNDHQAFFNTVDTVIQSALAGVGDTSS
jgi:hypothetical protein